MSLKIELNLNKVDERRPGVFSPVDMLLEAGEAMIASGMTERAVAHCLSGAMNEMAVHGLTMLRKQVEATPEKYPETIEGKPAADYFKDLAASSDAALIAAMCADLNMSI